MQYRITDNADCIGGYGLLTVKACDVDANGNVENVDIIYGKKLQFCINIQNPVASVEEMSKVLTLLCSMIMRQPYSEIE